MIKRILTLIIVLGALVLGGCSSEVARDTMTVELTWPIGSEEPGDCDLGIKGPLSTNDNHWITDPPWTITYGKFSENCLDGGTETWTLNYSHPTGYYMPMVYSHNYTGRIALTVTINGIEVCGDEDIEPGWLLTFMDFHVTRADGGPSYKVVRTYVGERPK